MGKKKLIGTLGKRFEVTEGGKPQQGSPRTPSIVYTRLQRRRPDMTKTTREWQFPFVWQAFSPSHGESAAVKWARSEAGKKRLKKENRALARLQGWSFFFRCLSHRIVPQLYQNLTVDRESGRWFIAFEWLEIGKHGKWKQLSEILQERRLKKREILQLQKALYRALRLMHCRRVAHGDIKDEHVLVKVVGKNAVGEIEYDFRTIRLIDFGMSHLFGIFSHKSTSRWEGASLGFCPPYFWGKRWMETVKRKKLYWLDRYAVDAVLYLALTGETFPVAFPSYKTVADLKQHLEELRTRLQERYQREFQNDYARKALANWLVDRLCVADPTESFHKGYKERLIHPFQQAFNLFYREQLESMNGKLLLYFLIVTLGGFGLCLVTGCNFFLAFALVSLFLAIGRWRSKEAFFLYDRDGGQHSSKTGWKSIVALSVWIIGGILAFPVEILPTVPVLAGLFVRKEGYWMGMILNVLGSLVTWMRLSRGVPPSSTFGAVPLQGWLSPLSLWGLLIGWLLAYIIGYGRYKVEKFAWKGLALMLMAAVWSWLFPFIMGNLLWFSAFELRSWKALLVGVANIIFVLLGSTYALWVVIADHGE